MLNRAIQRLARALRSVSADPVDALLDRPLLFDAAWYRRQAADCPDGARAAAEHYHTVGWRKGYAPGPSFDTRFYLDTYGDVRAAGIDPLTHYMEAGSREGRNPRADFDGKDYLVHHPILKQVARTALEHCLDNYRMASWPLVNDVREDAPALVGEAVLKASGLFHAAWYRAKYPDIAHLPDPFQHYLYRGSRENRSPNPYFDPVHYIAQAPDLRDAPLYDYLQVGWQQGRSPSKAFDPERYRVLAGWSPERDGEPLGHFLKNGLPGLTAPTVDPERPDYFIHLGQRDLSPLMPESLLRYPLDFESAKEVVPLGQFVPNSLRLHWIVPDFDVVGGGGMTIFRMVRALSQRGHRQTIWIHGVGPHATGAQAFDDIIRHYQTLDAEVLRFHEADFVNAEGDAVIATDWPSVWPAKAMTKVKRCFYFVQDYEPEFHPRGSAAFLSEATYREDLDCICASPWLARRMSERFGRWSRSFHLAADPSIYKPNPVAIDSQSQRSLPRIAFYARQHTARRVVDLGLLALEILAKRGHDFVVDLFGEKEGLRDAPFAFVQHGVRRPEMLAELYREATIGVVFSATNYSLVPQEMMACGLPVLELDVESTRQVYPDGVVSWAEPDSYAIADALEALLFDPERRAAQRKAALDWVSQFSWEGAADIVEASVRERLEEIGHVAAEPRPSRTEPKISVVIPTLNGGELLLDVLERVKSQRLADPFEILVIDSGSSDGTLEVIAADPQIRVHRIRPTEFGHGRTRNLGVSMTKGEYVAFLTQDALPIGDSWLADYVLMLDHFPQAGGAFGRHLARPDASPFVKRDIDAHFQRFFEQPLAVSRDLDPQRWAAKDEVWRQMLHFYSDNNSCLRRSIWEKLPYRDVAFGEDQLFAEDIITAGYQKIYVPSATVYHSHDYNMTETFERARTEAEFFKTYFGYVLMKDEATLHRTLHDLNAADALWGRSHQVPEPVIERRLRLNKARLEAYLAAQAEPADEEEDGMAKGSSR